MGSGEEGTGAGAITHLISPKEPLGSGEEGTGAGAITHLIFPKEPLGEELGTGAITCLLSLVGRLIILTLGLRRGLGRD